MKFRFCGDLDCPDWVLAEINTLSKMVRFGIIFVQDHVVYGLFLIVVIYQIKGISDTNFSILFGGRNELRKGIEIGHRQRRRHQ